MSEDLQSGSDLMTFSLSTAKCHNYVPLGMQNKKIPDNKITASSTYSKYYPASNARLHLKDKGSYYGAWCSKVNGGGQWIQVELDSLALVTAVATQSLYDSDSRVTSYGIAYSWDGKQFTDFNRGKMFTGNKDKNTVVKHDFHRPIIAKYIKLYVMSWHSHICLRMELYGCKVKW